MFALKLLEEHPEIVPGLQQQYPNILVDEYQDTNAAQDRLLSILAGDGERLTVVGDDDQSIYRFRGATLRNLSSFPDRFPNVKIVTLAHNFRSRVQIVDLTKGLIAHNPARYPKDLVSMRGRGCDVLLVYERSAGDEASTAVDLLRRLHQAGHIHRWEDVTVLLRSVRSYSEPYLKAFSEARIPYHVIGDASFFQRPEIAQLYGLFSFLGATKPWGDRFLRDPIVGLHLSTSEALASFKDNLLDITTDGGLESIGIGHSQDRATVLSLLRLKRLVQAKEHGSLIEVFYRLLAITGCVSAFEQARDVEALANIGQLSQLIARWDEYGSTRNFYPFQEYLKLLKEGGVDPVLVPPQDALRVMTIHQAKGLGFPVVVLGAAMKGRLPTSPRRQRYEIPTELTASGPPEVEDPHTVDERKLFYVAATRARDLLVVGTADVVEKRGGGPSPFVVEMFGEDLRSAADLTRAYVEEVESRPIALLEPMKRHSFSEMAYFLQCPMRYKFAIIYGFAAPWMDPVDFGANVHRAIEELHQRCIKGHAPSEGDVGEIIEETWVSSPRATPEEESGLRDAAENQIRRYLREHRSSLAAIQLAETSFAFNLEGRIVSGKVDLIRSVDDLGGTEIVDFKTSKSAPLREGRVDLQLGLYALGVQAALGRQVLRCTAHFLGDGQQVGSGWSRDLAHAAQAELVAVLEAIERGEFPPNQGYCASCQEFRSICPHAA
jgi:DNA helicase-2/ATP-dependent DNA helicase PcrA